MSALPALPQTHLSAESELAQLLQRVCADGRSALLQVSRSTSGEWNLSASPDLRAETLEFALDAARQTPSFLVPGDPDEIEAAVVQLKAATMRPVWMDAEDAIAYEDVLIKACQDYPIDVVQQGCANWRRVPEHGKWWPTEQDLRAQCEKVFAPRKNLFNRARVLLQDLREREREAQRVKQNSPFASDRGRAFREEMRKHLRPELHEAVFHHSQAMFAGDGAVVVRTDILVRRGAAIAKRIGVRIVHDPREFVNLRQPSPDDDTEQDRAYVIRKLGRLKRALAAGEDLQALHDAGEI